MWVTDVTSKPSNHFYIWISSGCQPNLPWILYERHLTMQGNAFPSSNCKYCHLCLNPYRRFKFHFLLLLYFIIFCYFNLFLERDMHCGINYLLPVNLVKTALFSNNIWNIRTGPSTFFSKDFIHMATPICSMYILRLSLKLPRAPKITCTNTNYFID